jgi:hypothetical protein
VLLLLPTLPTEAFAQRELLNPMGSKYTLVIDQLSGFRVGAFGQNNYGFSYAGLVGIVHQSDSERVIGPGVPLDGVARTTTIWLAPSADIFLFNFPLSLGALFEISSTSGSVDAVQGGVIRTNDLPTTTSITFLPRVGYLFAINDRFGIWPRGGLGYASRQQTDPTNFQNRFTLSGFVTDIDVGFLWRPVEAVFFRLGPEIAFSLGASHSATNAAGVTTSADASIFQIGLLGGIGVMFSL